MIDLSGSSSLDLFQFGLLPRCLLLLLLLLLHILAMFICCRLCCCCSSGFCCLLVFVGLRYNGCFGAANLSSISMVNVCCWYCSRMCFFLHHSLNLTFLALVVLTLVFGFDWSVQLLHLCFVSCNFASTTPSCLCVLNYCSFGCVCVWLNLQSDPRVLHKSFL